MPDVPFLCHFERAVGLTDRDPYNEIVRYLAVHRGCGRARVFPTLSYFDGVNFAKRATAPALVLGRADGPDLPAVDRLRRVQPLRGADKHIEVYAFNEHEGGQGLQWQRQAAWLAARLAG